MMLGRMGVPCIRGIKVIDKYIELFSILNKIEGGSLVTSFSTNVRYITSSQVYNKPSEILSIIVILVGGGGGGGGAADSSSSTIPTDVFGTGGGGGGVCVGAFSVGSIPDQVPVTIGGGGLKGGSDVSAPTHEDDLAASDGGTSSFGNLLTATGGQGGSANIGFISRFSSQTDNRYNVQAATGGTATGGDLNLDGDLGFHGE